VSKGKYMSWQEFVTSRAKDLRAKVKDARKHDEQKKMEGTPKV